MELFPNSFLMATRYPLAHRDHIYPEPHVIRLDMDPNAHHEFPTAKPRTTLPLYVSPSAAYTSSPSLDSQPDDDQIFDLDIDYTNVAPPQQHQHQHQLRYDSAASPSWDSVSTPQAWDGEPQRLSSFDTDSRKPTFGYPSAMSGATHHHHQDSGQLFADYLEDPNPAHSPPTAYISSPASMSTLGTVMAQPSYYPASSPGAQHSPYSLSARYGASLQNDHAPACDPRFVSPASGSPHAGPSSPHHQDVGISFADVYSDQSQAIKVEQDQGIGPATVLHQQLPYESDSGEDEKSESDDPTYVATESRSRPMSLPSVTRMRPRNMRSSSAGSSTTMGAGTRPARTLAPEPVPNLTKKSRGRRVPTAAALYGAAAAYSPAGSSGLSLNSGGKNARTYVCKVKDCGKCFARSEHLKRHVRSIHTNEKPHRCPHPGCNKEFSRHDNLCQHMRVHRNFSAPKDGAFGSF